MCSTIHRVDIMVMTALLHGARVCIFMCVYIQGCEVHMLISHFLFCWEDPQCTHTGVSESVFEKVVVTMFVIMVGVYPICLGLFSICVGIW